MTAPARTAKGFLKRSATENVGLKLVALVASVFLFVILRGSEDETRIVSVRVLQPQQNERMLVSDVPELVHVTLRGPLSLINGVRRDGLSEIRIPAQNDGAFFYIEQEQFELPAGVDVVQIEPSAVELIWQPRGEHSFVVDAVIEGQVAPGLIRVGTSVDPARVLIQGAEPELRRIERVHTRPIDIRSLTVGRHEIRVPLTPLSDHVDYAGGDSVVVTIMIEEEEGRRTLEDVGIALVGTADVVLRPDRVHIELRGPRARVDQLHPRRVVPFIDLTGFNPALGAQPLPVRLRPLPDDIQATTDPPEILVSPG